MQEFIRATACQLCRKDRLTWQNSANLGTGCATMEKNASKSLIAGRFEKKNGNNRVEVASVYSHITFVNKLLFFSVEYWFLEVFGCYLH